MEETACLYQAIDQAMTPAARRSDCGDCAASDGDYSCDVIGWISVSASFSFHERPGHIA